MSYPIKDAIRLATQSLRGPTDEVTVDQTHYPHCKLTVASCDGQNHVVYTPRRSVDIEDLVQEIKDLRKDTGHEFYLVSAGNEELKIDFDSSDGNIYHALMHAQTLSPA